MAKKTQSKIDLHPQSEDVKQYIYTERFEGVGFRLIANGLEDLFDIKISHTGVANWLKLNPAPAELEESEERTLNLDIFDDELYKEILPENATEAEKIKAKYYTLIQCNIDKHISTGKRLDNEYIKHLKTVLEVVKLEAQVQRDVRKVDVLDGKIDFNELTDEELDEYIETTENILDKARKRIGAQNKLQVEIITRTVEPDLSALNVEELKQLQRLVSKMNYKGGVEKYLVHEGQKCYANGIKPPITEEDDEDE